MTRSNPVVIPFPKRFKPLDCLDDPVCYFQAAAELRVAMLHKLFNILARSGVAAPAATELHELCQNARELLNDVVVLYRSSLAQAQGRAGDE
ncbi:hypothetical protein P8H27_07575 [Pseudomonas sp. sp1636]|uniref:hypothetical protein n=1 Tax=Pseudomonas sp. sp1636 TaxID=3036707 RepID=UPI0025A4F5CB|nr:hypothetical protein [Pseudomonas sp. sp1636]MDM8348758.1 hypothetical protein [Pseudomonas sp. sp1636]